MKKVLCVLMAALLLTMSVSSAFATKMFDRYWKPGEYTVELTDAEKAYYNSLYETALKKSEGTLFRENLDRSTYENKYKRYLEAIEERGTFGEVEFEDIGHYKYAVGLPDEQAISSQQALMIAYHVMKEQYDIEIGLQYQDGGGAYSGNTYEDGIEVTVTIETTADGEEAFVLLE